MTIENVYKGVGYRRFNRLLIIVQKKRTTIKEVNENINEINIYKKAQITESRRACCQGKIVLSRMLFEFRLILPVNDKSGCYRTMYCLVLGVYNYPFFC